VSSRNFGHYLLSSGPEDKSDFIFEFLKLAELRIFEAGSFLYEQGQSIDRFFLILEGIAETYRMSPSGQKKCFGMFGAGSLLGMSSLDGYRMHDSVRCKTNVLVATMPSESISLWSREMLLMLISIQTDKSRILLRQLVCEHIEPIASRIARLLIEAGSPYRRQENELVPSLAIFNYKEIAELINATPERVSQVLREMEKDGAVSLRNPFIIYTPHFLRRYLEGE
jgi:CRP-like cAMP-binding protein